MGASIDELASISFPDWRDWLARSELEPADQAYFAAEIVVFLRFCKSKHAAASVILIKTYLEEVEVQGPSRAREAGK